jgi:endonuclease/exonuclease/phosphatase family metal-dependent hydrolase
MIRIVFILLFLTLTQLCKTQNLSNLSFGTDSTFEILTWNIKQFPKAGQRSMDTVRNIIEALDVDLIALQEIDDTVKCKQMLLDLPDYGLLVGDPNEFEGLAYIYKKSSIQVKSLYHIFSSWSAGYNFPRAPLILEMIYAGREYVVINNHLKCCGDGILNLNDGTDEETRRYRAISDLKAYMDNFLSNKRTIMLGDLNDEIQEPLPQNVFQKFLNDHLNYQFVDEGIALGPSQDWSYPNWPSHLDHILINQKLFYDFQQRGTEVICFSIDEYLPGGLAEYEQKVSDHRPLGLKMKVKPVLGLSFTEIQEEEAAVRLYPNPATDRLYIELPSTTIQSYQIFDAFGRSFLQGVVNQEEKMINLELSDLSKGLYFIRLCTVDQKFMSLKFYKMNSK